MKYVLLLCFFLAQLAHAITLDDLQARFKAQPTVRAQFTQTRQIKNMNMPLVSQGQVLISQEKGIWWHQDSPFAMSMILNDQRMVQRIPGQADMVLTAQNNPQMFQFNALMRGLLQADKKLILDNFTVDLKEDSPTQWHLTLTPKTSPLDKIFSQIQLVGDQQLNGVTILDKQGDQTTIKFTNHRLTPKQLTPAEAHYFD